MGQPSLPLMSSQMMYSCNYIDYIWVSFVCSCNLLFIKTSQYKSENFWNLWYWLGVWKSYHFKSLQAPLIVNNSPRIISSDPCAIVRFSYTMSQGRSQCVNVVPGAQCLFVTLCLTLQCYFVPWDLSPLPPPRWCLWESPSNSQYHSKPSTLGSAHLLNTLRVCGNLPSWER